MHFLADTDSLFSNSREQAAVPLRETGRGRAGAVAALLALSLGLVGFNLAGCSPASQNSSSSNAASPSATTNSEVTSSATAEPTPTETTPEPTGSLAGKRIMIDPGHNGGNGSAQMRQQVPDGRGGYKACNTTGTATSSGYSEHQFNWEVAQVLKTQLEKAGATVLLTRDSDNGVGPCVDQRGRVAGEQHADILVSIHANGSNSPAPHGFFVMTSSPALNEAQGAPSTALANSLIQNLTAVGLTPSTSFGSKIYARRDLATLNNSTVPVAMVELGEMRNAEDAARMQSEDGRALYAKGLYEGIVAYFQQAGH